MLAERVATFTTIPHEHSDLRWMLARLKEHTPEFSHQTFKAPQCWYGYLDAEGAIVAAFGWDGYLDGTIEIRYAVARPSKAGAFMLHALAQAFTRLPTRIVFYSRTKNARMKRIAHEMGCEPIVVMYERRRRADEQSRVEPSPQ